MIYFLKKFKFLILGFVVSILVVYNFLPDTFLGPYSNSDITITATATKNEYSGGTDIRIIRVKINDQEIPFDNFEQVGEWEFRDGVLMIVNPSYPATLTYHATSADHIEIDFQKHEGSGIVSIEENNKIIKKIDLYSPDWDNEQFIHRLGHVSVFNNKWNYLSIFLYIEAFIILVPFLKNSIKKRPHRVRWGSIIIFLCASLYYEYIYYSTSDNQIMSYGILSGITLISSMSFVELLRQKQVGGQFQDVLISNIWMIISATFIFFATLLIGQDLKTISLIYICGNIIVYLTLIFIMYIISRRITIAISAVAILSCIFACANYFVYLFRSTPIAPGDFLSVGTAATVFVNYKYEIPWEMALAVWVIFTNIFATAYLFGLQKICRKHALWWACPSAILLGIIFDGNFYAPQLNLWDLNSNVTQYGLAMSFISTARNMYITEPTDYKEKDSSLYMSTFIDSQENKSGFRPNIIAIMNESFSDISIFSDELDYSEFLPYFYSIQDNTVRGNMLVYPLGGTTADTEYEFLTGNSMSFIIGTVPYQQFIIRKGTYSIAQILKNRGYRTIGIHPYYKKGYSRFKVYPFLGFDEFLDIESFDDPELVRGLYPSDQDSYEKVIEQYEQNCNSGDPIFIFNVTMQNHSGYETGFFGDEVIRIPGHEGEFPRAEEYLTLIKKSDEAIPTLINYFSSVEEPTILIFFGDHQPALENEFYETMLGKPSPEWSLEDLEKQYTVPFFIWANFDIPTQTDVFTSANYLSELLFETAGMDLVPYQEFLKDLRSQIPAINGNGFLSSDGSWHLNTENSSILDEYWRLQYRNMFDKKIHY